MPRKARQKSGTGFYHVIARGLDKEPVFQTGAEKRRNAGNYQGKSGEIPRCPFTLIV